MNKTKDFKLVAISDNANSFGLHGHIFVSSDGEAWDCAGYRGPGHNLGFLDVVRVPLDFAGNPDWGFLEYEIPEKLPPAPPGVIAEIWPERN